MLQELESIKALLLEEDNIPLLQSNERHEVIPTLNPDDDIPTLQAAHEFIPTLNSDEDIPLLNDTLNYSSPSSRKLSQADFFTPPHREPLAKGSGDNPFLPQHIRARLHGNNPPPLFETEAAQRIAQLNQPIRSTQATKYLTQSRAELINELIEKILPELHHELTVKLEKMTIEELEFLLKN